MRIRIISERGEGITSIYVGGELLGTVKTKSIVENDTVVSIIAHDGTTAMLINKMGNDVKIEEVD